MSLNKSEALDAAKQYVLQRNLPAALQIYQKIVEADPSDLSAVNTLGDLYASTGNIKEAIDHFSRLATIYIDGGHSRKAITALKKIIAVDPANIETAIKLADLYAEAGLPSEARQHYLQIAEALMRNGQRLDALNVYTKVVELDPMNTPTRIRLGELFLREGMNDQAYGAFMIAADQLAQKGEHRRALNAYNEALSIKPGNVEALTAQRKLMAVLGISDRPQPEAVNNSGSANEKPSQSRTAPLGSQSPADDRPKNIESSFVVQEISKAEILVAYGQVTQALRMLKNVLRENPDSLDVHVKLKDIYLRTGMMAEAATECRELERIHQSRGESDRARDYAVRASRLTNLLEQPSGDLDRPDPKMPAAPPVQMPASVVASSNAQPIQPQAQAPLPEVASSQKPSSSAPQVKMQPPVVSPTVENQPPASPNTTPAKPQVTTPPVVSAQNPSPAVPGIKAPPVAGSQRPSPVAPQVKTPPQVVAQNPATADAQINTPSKVVAPPNATPLPTKTKVAQDQKPLLVTTRIDLPLAQQLNTQISVAQEKTPDVSVVETPLTDLRFVAPSVEVEKTAVTVPAKVDEPSLDESSLSVIPDSVAQVELPRVFAASSLATKSRPAMIAAGVLVLSISAVIGGFAYNSFLDHQYQTLAVAAPPLVSPAPPTDLDAAQLQTQDVQNDAPLSVTVNAAAMPDVTTRRESKDPEPPKTQEPKTPVPQPVREPARIVPSPSPVLPRVSFSPDTNVGADSRVPSGVPVEVPIGASQPPAEPPAKVVRQSPGVVMGSAIRKVDPVYPPAARSAGQSGAVKVEVSINERGDVISAKALSGPALLQSAAVSAARAWKFKASTLGGVPVTTTTTIVFNFKL